MHLHKLDLCKVRQSCALTYRSPIYDGPVACKGSTEGSRQLKETPDWVNIPRLRLFPLSILGYHPHPWRILAMNTVSDY